MLGRENAAVSDLNRRQLFLPLKNSVLVILGLKPGGEILTSPAMCFLKKTGYISLFVCFFLGAGGAVVTSCEQLLKGDWKPAGDEWLKMSL